MADVIGTISACIDLAEKIANMVEKFAQARQRIQTIANDVSLLQSILKQLKDVLKPDLTASYTAVHLTRNGQHNTLTAANRCQKVFAKIWSELSNTLYDKRFQAKLERHEVIHINWVVRLSWIFKESSISELREELNRSKQDVMLSLSVNLLSISKQPVQLHPLDQRELARLKATVELIWAEKRAVGTSVQPFQPLSSASGVSAAANQNNATDDRGLVAAETAYPSTLNDFCKRIYRVSRSIVSTEVLDEKQIRWLNDPFDQNAITIYDELNENEFRALHKLTLELNEPPKRHHQARILEVQNREDLELARMKAEVRVKQQTEEDAKESFSSFHPSEDIADALIKEWTLPPPGVKEVYSEMPTTYKTQYLTDAELAKVAKKSMKTRECPYRFQAGEWMYSCETCGVDDKIVFCYDCFNSTDHVGHFTERRRARGNQSYCDCGRSDTVAERVHCNIHADLAASFLSKDRDSVAADRIFSDPGRDQRLLIRPIDESRRAATGKMHDQVLLNELLCDPYGLWVLFEHCNFPAGAQDRRILEIAKDVA